MKLLYVTSGFPYGGSESFIATEIEALLALGHSVWIVPMQPRKDILHSSYKHLLSHTITEPVISGRLLLRASRIAVTNPQQARQALSILITNNPVHLVKNLAVFPKGLWLAEQASALGIEHIHAHWSATTASMALVASTVSGIPWSFTAHRWDIKEANLLERKTVHAQFARFISNDGLELARQNGLETVDRACVLHMGVKLPENSAIPIPKAVHKEFRLLCPASLIERKGHRYLFQALAQLKNLPLELWLAGDGPLKKELEYEAQKLGIAPQVRFMGALPHNELMRVYALGQVDAVVLPTLHEGIPVSLMEAMSYRIPVISTHTGGIPELLSSDAGIMVREKDPGALATAIQELYLSTDLQVRLGQAGWNRVQQEFELFSVINKLVQRFEKRLSY